MVLKSKNSIMLKSRKIEINFEYKKFLHFQKMTSI